MLNVIRVKTCLVLVTVVALASCEPRDIGVVTVEANGTQAGEGDTLRLLVTTERRRSLRVEENVAYRMSGQARYGRDYTLLDRNGEVLPQEGNLPWPTATFSVGMQVVVRDDFMLEGDEALIFEIVDMNQTEAMLPADPRWSFMLVDNEEFLEPGFGVVGSLTWDTGSNRPTEDANLDLWVGEVRDDDTRRWVDYGGLLYSFETAGIPATEPAGTYGWRVFYERASLQFLEEVEYSLALTYPNGQHEVVSGIFERAEEGNSEDALVATFTPN
ncbi:MAG: hypothetical protein AAFQ98_14220 [Bacteroidota bacterium]